MIWVTCPLTKDGKHAPTEDTGEIFLDGKRVAAWAQTVCSKCGKPLSVPRPLPESPSQESP